MRKLNKCQTPGHIGKVCAKSASQRRVLSVKMLTVTGEANPARKPPKVCVTFTPLQGTPVLTEAVVGKNSVLRLHQQILEPLYVKLFHLAMLVDSICT